MNEIMQILDLGRTGAIIGFICFLFGVLLSYYFYKKGETRIKPAYVRYDGQVIGINENSLQSDIKIVYKDQEIKNLVRTVFIIWNDGRKTLDQSHFTAAYPPQICFSEGAVVYAWSVKKVTNMSSEVSVIRKSESTQNLNLNFSHLDYQDGAVIEIYHNDGWDSPVILSGFKECKNGFEFRGRIAEFSPKMAPESLFSRSLREYNIPKIQIAIGVILIVIGLLPNEVRYSLNNPEWLLPFKREIEGNSLVPIVAGCLFTIISILSLVQKSKKKFPVELLSLDPVRGIERHNAV